MKNSVPEFVLMVSEPANSEGSYTYCRFRCFACIEDLCDFIEDKLLPKEWDAHSEWLSLNDLKRLRKQFLVVLENVRRGYLLEDSDRKELNRISKAFDFQIPWWGKFSFLAKSKTQVALDVREDFYKSMCMGLEDEYGDRDIPKHRLFDHTKEIPKARLNDFHRFLGGNSSEMDEC